MWNFAVLILASLFVISGCVQPSDSALPGGSDPNSIGGKSGGPGGLNFIGAAPTPTASPSPAPSGGGSTSGGNGTSLSAASYFDSSMFFNQAITDSPKSSQSDILIQSLTSRGGWGTGSMKIDFHIDVYYADGSTTRRPYIDNGGPQPDSDEPATIASPPSGANGFESSSGTSLDGGDDHYLVVDSTNHILVELYQGFFSGGNILSQGGAYIWDFEKNYPANLRGDVCTSADAGGLPIAPLLFTAEEINVGVISHAIRLILPNARIQASTYVRPATHGVRGAGNTTLNGIPYGSRFRLRPDYPINTLPTAGAQTVATALENYGMILADGGNIAFTAKSDTYSTAKYGSLLASTDLSALQPSNFEIIDAGPAIVFSSFNCIRAP